LITKKYSKNVFFLFYRKDEEEKKPKPPAAAGNKQTAPVFSGKPKDVVCSLEYLFF
jgi:hypothetical protein